MSKRKKNKDSEKGYIVVWTNGYGDEKQSFDLDSHSWEFSKSEIEAQCRKEVSKGAVKVSAWFIGSTPPVMVLSFKRSEGGGCVQTFPDTYKQTYRNPFSKKEE